MEIDGLTVLAVLVFLAPFVIMGVMARASRRATRDRPPPPPRRPVRPTRSQVEPGPIETTSPPAASTGRSAPIETGSTGRQ